MDSKDIIDDVKEHVKELVQASAPTPEMKRKAANDLERYFADLSICSYLWGSVLVQLHSRNVSTELETAWIAFQRKDRTLSININPVFWEYLTDDIPSLESKANFPSELYRDNLYINEIIKKMGPGYGYKTGVFIHELLHVILQHYNLADKYPNADLFGLAIDMVVNSFIPPKFLPHYSIHYKMLKGLELLPQQSVEYYYSAVGDYIRQNGRDDLLETTVGTPNSQEKNGNDSNSKKNEHVEEDMKTLERLLKKSKHDFAGDEQSADAMRGYGDSFRKEIRRYINSRKEIGHGAGNLLRLFDEIETVPPVTDWAKQMRAFITSSIKTKIKNTIKRRSKRYGTRPGLKINRFCSVLVAVDTSGSIGTDELERFNNEVRWIHDTGHSVTVAYCDATLQGVEEFNGISFTAAPGGGGTSFTPPLEYANEENRFNCIVYLTDGFGAVPEVDVNIPLIWVVTSDTEMENFPGIVIRMN